MKLTTPTRRDPSRISKPAVASDGDKVMLIPPS
jgi:hypothetical protein